MELRIKNYLNGMNFSTEELVDMVFVLGASDRNGLLATRLYHEKYPERRQPRTEAFERLLHRFDRTGNVMYEKSTVYTEENEITAMLKIAENPHISQRTIADETDIHRATIQKILVRHTMHPYYIQLTQELNNQDYENGVHFCEQAQEKIRQNQIFLIMYFLPTKQHSIRMVVLTDTISIIMHRIARQDGL